MNRDPQTDALINSLVNQRNAAHNMAAELEAALFVANVRVGEFDRANKELSAKLADQEEELKRLRPPPACSADMPKEA